jgi:hypothetical protein
MLTRRGGFRAFLLRIRHCNCHYLAGAARSKELSCSEIGSQQASQMQNGLPYPVCVSSYNSADAILTNWNGAGGATPLIPGIGPNTRQYPRHIVDDVRAQKAFTIKEGYQLQLLANVFNIANHQNIDGINTTAHLLSSTGALSGTATFQPTYGQITSSNNSGFLYTPRQIEIAARFSF